jgi:aminoglycoside phosphotransferase (APT) family kinase protein
MLTSQASRAIAAAKSVASSLGLAAADAVVIQNSNKLTLRLLPCDVLARVAPATEQVAQFEVDLALRLTEAGCPIGTLDPRVPARVCERDGFTITLWTYYEPVTGLDVTPADYACALRQLHAGLRKVDIPAPHFTDRVEEARQLVADPTQTPELPEPDRELLADALQTLRQAITCRDAPEQLLHGEPHPGNLLATGQGLLFIDLETCCRGPIEFDLAHAPEEVADHYLAINKDLLRDCRHLMLAMIISWRWDSNDQLPNGRELASEWLTQLRSALSHPRSE